MKWNTRAKLTATATSALLMALIIAGCSNNNDKNNVNLPVNSQIQQEQTQSENDADTEVTSPEDDAANEEEQQTVETSTPPVVQDNSSYEATGTYIGAIDNNSIEIVINGEPTVFLLSDAFDYVISDFSENSKVTVTYKKQLTEDGNYTQNIVTAISNAK